MQNIQDLLQPVVATLLARQVPEPVENDLTGILPNVKVQGRKAKTVRRTRRTTTAKYRAYSAEAPIGRRSETLTIQELVLPAISEKLPIDEDLLLALVEGASDAAIARLVEAMYDDVENLTTSILNRYVLARGQFLQTGKVTINENGFVDEADYGLPADHLVTASTVWTDPTALALDMEQVWVRKVRTDARTPVTKATTSERIRNALLRNDQYRGFFWPGVTNPPTLIPNQLDQVRAQFSLPPLELSDDEIPTDTGTARVIADDKFILTTANVGESQWGVTAEARELVGSNSVDFTQEQAPGLTVVTFKTPDPVTEWTKVSAIGMPVAGEINGLLVADVAA